MYHISHRFIKEGGEDRIGKCLNNIIIGVEIDHLVETTIIEDMEEVEVILREVIFEAGLVIILEGMIIEIEKIEGHGGSLDHEKEEGELGQNQVLDPVQELV